MPPPMSQKAISEYLQIQQTRCQNRPGRKARSLLLDECMTFSGLGRKHLIKVLGGRLPVGGQPGTGARPSPCLWGNSPPHQGPLARQRTTLRQTPQAHPAGMGAMIWHTCGPPAPMGAEFPCPGTMPICTGPVSPTTKITPSPPMLKSTPPYRTRHTAPASRPAPTASAPSPRCPRYPAR